jgi:aldehyde dehydrogenase (NAD+)
MRHIHRKYSSPTANDFNVVNVNTGEVHLTVRAGDKDTVDKAVHAARAAFQWRSALTWNERADYLNRCANGLKSHKAVLCDSLAIETGITTHVTTYRDIDVARDVLQSFVQHLEPGAPEFVAQQHGVCAALLGHTWPLLRLMYEIGPWLAHGNTMVLCFDQRAPLTCMRAVEMMSTVLPKGVLAHVPSSGDVVVHEALLVHPLVPKFLTSGSVNFYG